MLETPHVAVGMAIATTIPNPLISIPLALTSHFLLDMTPHWNPHLNTETKKYGHLTNRTLLIIGLDLACATLLTIYFGRGNNLFYLCALASILPDLIEAPYFLIGTRNKFLKFWIKFQKSIQVDANLFWGLLTQILVLLGSFYIIS